MFRSLRTLRSIPRLKDITFVLGRHGFHQVASSLHSPFTSRVRRLFKREPGHVIEQPERLRLVLEDLGPTFIKFGQLLSTRPDLLPESYIEELEKLQDDVPPLPFEEIREILDEEFNGKVDELFREIHPDPLATASIAQVHRATSKDGTEVVLKVRKPGLERVIEQDLLVLGLLIDFLSGWRGLSLFDPEGVLRIFERSIRRELNFDYERGNLLRLRENMPEGSIAYVPKPFPELSTAGVLTMEYLHGEKLSSYHRQGMSRARGEKLAHGFATCFLKQIFEDGLFHADAHPGNIILMNDGRIGLIDVGNVGRLTQELTDELVAVLVALVRQDYRSLARWILRQGRPTTEIDPQSLAMELMDQLDPYYGLSLDEIRLGDLFNALFEMVLRHGIRVPPQFVNVGRTFVLLENSVRLCAPHLDVVPHVQPYVETVMRKRWSPDRIAREVEAEFREIASAVRTFPSQISEVLARTAEGRLRVETFSRDLQHVERKLDVLANRVPAAIVISAMLVASASILFVPNAAWSQIVGVSGITISLLLGARIVWR